MPPQMMLQFQPSELCIDSGLLRNHAETHEVCSLRFLGSQRCHGLDILTFPASALFNEPAAFDAIGHQTPGVYS